MFSRLTPWLISIIAIAIALFSIKSCSDKKEEGERLKSNLLIAKDSVHHLRGKNGELINRVGSMQLTVSDLKTQNQQLGLDKDILKKQVGNLNNLLSFYKGKINSKGTILSIVHDTVFIQKGISTHYKSFRYTNKYLYLDEFYNPLNDSIKIKYNYSTDFTYTTYYKPVGFLKFKKILVTDIVLTDPNASLINGTSVSIIPPKKKWYQTDLFKVGVGFVAGKYLLR